MSFHYFCQLEGGMCPKWDAGVRQEQQVKFSLGKLNAITDTNLCVPPFSIAQLYFLSVSSAPFYSLFFLLHEKISVRATWTNVIRIPLTVSLSLRL